MLERARSLVGLHAGTTVHECRNCGAAVDPEADECPYCGPTDVVTYEI